MDFISLFFLFYGILILSYLWIRFGLLCHTDLLKKKNYPEYKSKNSVIVPIYNESPPLLKKCVHSLIQAEGNNQIILVDDGSKNNIWETIKELKAEYPQITIIKSKKNKGKREAQDLALKYVKGDIIITVDSDTIIDKKAFTELVKPFNDKSVGATTGNCFALNEKKNLLTKLISARYFSAFQIERKSMSNLGVISCCSGVLASYRTALVKKLRYRYTCQIFMGKKCTYGDDRYLTNLILQEGYQTKYVETAKAYTNVPETYKGFFTQQCLHPNEKMLIKKDGKVSIISMKDLWGSE